MGVTWVCCSCSMGGRGRPEKRRTTKLRKPCTLPLCSASPWWNLWIYTVESKNVQLLPKTAIRIPQTMTPYVDIFMLKDLFIGFYFILHFLPTKDIWMFLKVQVASLWGQVENGGHDRRWNTYWDAHKTWAPQQSQQQMQTTSVKRSNVTIS